MIKNPQLRTGRLVAGLAITLLALSACASSNTSGENNLDRYDRQVLSQLGGS